jgi:ribosomal protein S18 acetylase RimI-like enzyme
MIIIIQKAIPEDAKEWCKIHKDTWLDTYPNKEFNITKTDILSKDFDSPEKVKKWEKSFDNPQGRYYYVAKTDNKIVGLATGLVHKDINEIGAIYVLPKYQGKGVGKELMIELIKHFDSTKKIKLNVVRYNIKAINFYKKFGFIITGNIDDPSGTLPNGKVLPEFQMVKET